MKDMMQALRWAFRYKYSLVFSILFSALVAASWGANISAVYPFVEVIFQGKTLHHWADDQIRATQQQLAALPAPNGQVVPAPEAKPADADASTEVEQWKTADQRAKLQSRLENYEKARVWIDRYAPHDPFRTLVAILAFLIAGTIVKSFFRVTSGLLVARASGRMTEDLRNAYFRTLLSDRPLGGQQVGDAAARVGGDIGAIGAAVQILFGRSVQEPLKMGACLLGAAMVNWRLLIFSLLSCPLASLLLIALARSIRHASLRAFDQRCLLMGRMLQTFQGLTVVKAYNMESHERRRFWEHGLKVYREQLKITWYEGLIRSNNELLGIAVMCLSALAGGYLVLEQQTHLLGLRLAVTPMDFGQIMLFYAFLIGCTDPLRKMGDVYGTLQGGIAAAERIMPFISNPSVDPDRHKLRITDARAALTFDNVHFHYVPFASSSARRWRSSAPTDRASRRSSTCCSASSNPPEAASCWATTTCWTFAARHFAATWPLSARRQCSSTTPSTTTSRTARVARSARMSSARPSRRTRTSSSPRTWPAATTPTAVMVDSVCQEASSSGSPSRERSSASRTS
jgi:ATP-binding cassette subfamily B protein/subfamily B ATP-binding cassette protein MsbA